jgi:hypothetical protein
LQRKRGVEMLKQQKQITVDFDEEKIRALNKFAPNFDIKGELSGVLDTAYKKKVPKPVRDFIEDEGPEQGVKENGND